MKKRIISLLALVLVCVMALASCGGSNVKLTMGTGGSTGTYYAVGGALSKNIQTHAGLSCVHVSTAGSAANILGIAQGDYNLGFVQSDVMAYAWAGEKTFATDGAVKDFRVLGGLYAEAVQLVTTDPSIKSPADLRGKTVSIGAINSGVFFNAVDVLEAVGIDYENPDHINVKYQDFAASADSLKDRQIDAAFIVAGAPTGAITDLMIGNANARLVPIDGDIAEAIKTKCPYYTNYTIPAGTYANQTEDVNTITVKATLIVSADLDEDTVYNITKAIFDHIDDINHAKKAEFSLENATSGMTAPFHKGAARYFSEKGINVTAE